MDVDRDFSRFEPWAAAGVTPADAFLSELAEATDNYNIPGQEDQVLTRVLARLYRWLDSLSGNDSFFLSRKNAQNLYPILQVVNFLKEKGLIEEAKLNTLRYNDAPAMVRVDVSTPHMSGLTDGSVEKRSFGHGCASDPRVSYSRAIGEFLERYFLRLYSANAFIRATEKHLAKRGYAHIELGHLAGFSEVQKEHSTRFKWDERSIFSWETVVRYSTGRKAYAPAQLVYWNYLMAENEPILREANSNGAGGMFTKEGAILSGLYELIQRDSFFVHWLNLIAPERVDPRTIPNSDFQRLYQQSRRYGFEVYCLNTTSDIGVPACAVVIEDPTGNFPHMSLGAGCEADLGRAFQKALDEAWSVYYWTKPLDAYELPPSYQPFRDSSVNQINRLRLTGNPATREKVSFLIAGVMKSFSELSIAYPQKFESPKQELDYLVQRVERLGPGYEVYYYEAHHKILSKLGYHSVRAIVPKLVPLYLSETRAPLGSTRLKEFPISIGKTAPQEPNPFPHPFP